MTLKWYGIVSPKGRLMATEEDRDAAYLIVAALGDGYKVVPVIINWDLAK